MKKQNQKGFTLVEILATVAIMGILTGLAITAYSRYIDYSRSKAYEYMVKSAQIAMENYLLNHPDVTEVTLEELLEKGAYNVLSFGPALVENGNISVDENEEVGKAMSSNPRTAIGIIDENHYVLVVSDGRTNDSVGLSLYELAQFMQKLGSVTAYNLDGGGSSTMYFNGNIVNNPTTNGNKISERSISDIVYVGY